MPDTIPIPPASSAPASTGTPSPAAATPPAAPAPAPDRFAAARGELHKDGTLGGEKAPNAPSGEPSTAELMPELGDLNKDLPPGETPITPEELAAEMAGNPTPPSDGPESGDEIELEEFELPPLQEGEEALRIPVADPVAAARLEAYLQRADANNAEVQTLKYEAESQLAEADSFLANLRADPAGAIMQAIGNPQQVAEFAVELLISNPDLQKQVIDRLSLFEEKPAELEAYKTRQGALKERRQQTAQQFLEERQFSRKWNSDVMRQVHQLIPATFDKDAREVAIRDALQDLQLAIQRNDGYYFDPAEVPNKLAARVKLWGGRRAAPPPKPAAAPAAGRTPQGSAAGASSPSKPAGPTPEQVAAATRTPEAIRTAILRRRQQAIAGSGGGVPASAETFDPSKMKSSEVFTALKKRMGVK